MPDDTDEIARRALSIAAALGAADPGEKAEARRMSEAGAPIFWRQVARLGIAPHHEAAWLRFTRMVALLTSAATTASIHEPGQRLGTVLAINVSEQNRAPRYSEQRLARLIASRDEARLETLERAIRMLARHRPKIDVVDLARAVLGRNENRLARDYYAQRDKTEEVANA